MSRPRRKGTDRDPLTLPGDQPPLSYVGAERALLGTLMLHPGVLEDVGDLLTPAAFYRPEHGRLWSLIRERVDQGRPVDRVALGEAVLARGDAEFGGFAYVIALPESATTRAHAKRAAEEIRTAAARRSAQRSLIELAELIGDPAVGLDALAATFEAVAAGMTSTEGDADGEWVWMDAAVDAAQRAQDSGGASLGMPVPLRAWAEYVPHLTPGELHIVAARPAMGKSALARCVAEHVASLGYGVGIVSLEMDPEQIARMSLASWSEVDARDVRDGRLDQHAWDRIERARTDLGRLAIAITRDADLSVEDVVARSRRLKRRMAARGIELGLIVVDYLQLLRAPPGSDDRVRVVAEQSRALKVLARSLNVPVLCLSQLNRAVEQRADKRPIMADLRDSGAIEQDAATITMVYRPWVYDPDEDPTAAELIVRKNRYGTTGTAHVRFIGSKARFQDAAMASLEVV